MNDEEFKQLRHRFWKLGKERRSSVIKKMEFRVDPGDTIQGETQVVYLYVLSVKGSLVSNPEVTLAKGNQNIPTAEMMLQAERIEREILFYIRKNPVLLDELIALIEVEEAQITAAEEKAEYLRPPPIREVPPSKEELDAMKYVPGVKKEI